MSPSVISRRTIKAPIIDKENNEFKGTIEVGTELTLATGTTVSYNPRFNTFKITYPAQPKKYRSLSLVRDNSGNVIYDKPTSITVKANKMIEKFSKEFVRFLVKEFLNMEAMV